MHSAADVLPFWSLCFRYINLLDDSTLDDGNVLAAASKTSILWDIPRKQRGLLWCTTFLKISHHAGAGCSFLEEGILAAVFLPSVSGRWETLLHFECPFGKKQLFQFLSVVLNEIFWVYGDIHGKVPSAGDRNLIQRNGGGNVWWHVQFDETERWLRIDSNFSKIS